MISSDILGFIFCSVWLFLHILQGKEQSSVKNLISSLESSGQQVIKPYLYKKPPQQGELSPRDAQEEEVTKKVVQGRKGTPKALEDSLEDDTEDESTDEKPTMPKVTVTVDESQVDEGDERQVHTPNPGESLKFEIQPELFS